MTKLKIYSKISLVLLFKTEYYARDRTLEYVVVVVDANFYFFKFTNNDRVCKKKL